MLPAVLMQAEQPRAGREQGGSSRLGGARADFVAGLGRKVADLRGTLARVRGERADIAPREELRRKLHALGSAAKLMKFDAMDRGISEALGTIDRTAIDAALDAVDLDALEQVIEDLPALAWGDGHSRSSHAEAAQKAAPPRWSALVVGTALIAEALVEEIEGARGTFDCESTPDAQAAYDLVRTTEPDLVVLDADLDYATELVEALMDDPLTERVPVVVVGSFLEAGESSRYVAMGVNATLAKPTSREMLREVCEDAVDPRRPPKPGVALLGEPTLEELGERLANEIKDAIVGRADPAARGKKIPLGEGTEVLGAVWGAIARVREVVTSRTDGAIRFAPGPDGALSMAPPLHDPEVARADRGRARARGNAAEVRLNGRRILVADDDPAVVWFMADLLKTAGCTVHEAFDGQQALELAYKTSPDLVISDILMPNMDGFSLCRALRRDVALRDAPVILLSWKEDLLQRVRELGAGAAGYVRKESDARAIIARVREALRPRARVEARLRDDGEVRGRLDGVSVRTLLEIVCATRPEARVSIRDATFLYEVEIRWGAPQRATRTAGDGAFLKGTKALAAMLGVGAGRFTVTNSLAPIEGELDGNLAAQLAKPIARARAATMLLTGAEMTRIGRVELDEPALADYLRATPERARLVARRLAAGMPPRDLVLGGACEPALLDDLTTDLASRGVVLGIEDDDGHDMFTPTVAHLMQHTDTRASFAPRTATPSPVPANGMGACANDAASPLCQSPAPSAAASLEDAVLREVSHRSPEPLQAMLPHAERAPIVEPSTLRPRTSPPPPTVEEAYMTPPAEQIAALGEATVIDDTTYGEPREESIPIEESLGIDRSPSPASQEKTPLTHVSSREELPRPKRKPWPMIACVAASCIVAWAVVHFSMSARAPKVNEVSPPPPPVMMVAEPAPVTPAPVSLPTPAQEVAYTAAEADVPAGQGVLDVSAPADAVVVVDGKERARGSATLPIARGNHDVRVKTPTADERGCTVDVRERRVAHVKF